MIIIDALKNGRSVKVDRARNRVESVSNLALVADLHIGPNDHVEGGALDHRALAAALEALAARVDHVLLAGDILELHHGALPLAFARELREVRRRYPALVSVLCGPRFVRLVGNHDRALARLLGHHEDLRLDVGGRRLVVLHGHQVDLLHTWIPRLEATASWAAATVQRAGISGAWNAATSLSGRVNGMQSAAADSAYTQRVLEWGRSRGATWIAHGHDHKPLLVTRDGITLVRPGASLGGTLRYALLDLTTGDASLHREAL